LNLIHYRITRPLADEHCSSPGLYSLDECVMRQKFICDSALSAFSALTGVLKLEIFNPHSGKS
jgi:hypothetical protein